MKKVLSMVCLAVLCSGMANAAQCPSWQTYNHKLFGPILELQSRDDIIIKNMIINRGNCSYTKKLLGFTELDPSNAVSEAQKQEILAHNKWVKNTKKDENGYPTLVCKDGSCNVGFRETIMFFQDTTNTIYNLLVNGGAIPYMLSFGTNEKTEDEKLVINEYDELSNGAFVTHDYLIGKTFKFSEKITFVLGCDINDVLEVKLETNLGECVIPSKSK